MTIKTHKGEAETAPCFSQTAITKDSSESADQRKQTYYDDIPIRTIAEAERFCDVPNYHELKCSDCGRVVDKDETKDYQAQANCVDGCRGQMMGTGWGGWYNHWRDLARELLEQQSTSGVFNNPELSQDSQASPPGSSSPPDAGVVVNETGDGMFPTNVDIYAPTKDFWGTSESPISATLAEIFIRQDARKALHRAQQPFDLQTVLWDVDRLRSIIDSLQAENERLNSEWSARYVSVVGGLRDEVAALTSAASNMKTLIVERVREIAGNYNNTTQPNTGTSIAKQTAFYILRQLEAIEPNDLSGR